MAELTRPDGIDAQAETAPRGARRYASPLTLLLFGAILLAAFAGVFGGRHHGDPLNRSSHAATLTVAMPTRLRNGEFYEARILVEARQPIADAVVAISPELWRDMTINTHVPAASEETFEDGRFAFAYGALSAGETLEIKLDGQINPSLLGGNSGVVTLRDGERTLIDLPVAVTVLP